MLIEVPTHGFIELFMFMVSLCVIFGHNLWLVGKRETDGKTRIEVNTGDDFPSSDSAVKTERIADFHVVSVDGEVKIDEFRIEGTSLIADVAQAGPLIAAIELRPHPITLEADRFAHYVEDEDAADFTAPDFVTGKTTAPQRESYAKFAKVLVGNDAADLSMLTKPLGQKLEIVVADYADPAKLRVRVLFAGEPLINLRVSYGAENLNGGKYAAHTRTDDDGFADVEFTQAGHWFIRTHYIRKHADSAEFEWESFWASLTMRI